MQAQGRGGRGGGGATLPAAAMGARRQSGVVEDNGGIRYINPGSPTIPDAEINSHPIPRMPDGHVDLTGPWVGGGSNGDIERDGGLKPGELPLQPCGEGAARQARLEGRTLHRVPPDERAAREPVSVEVRVRIRSQRVDPHLRPARDGRRRRAPRGLHGRAPASRGTG